MNISPIGHIYTPFSEKFAIPRQAGIVTQARGTLQFTEAFCCPEALDGLKSHSHYWLIWGFSQHLDKEKSLWVRPPRLGGNQRIGVFASRSPFRPNNLGLSVVKLESVNSADFGLVVSGVDMLNASPIYDIKPYSPYVDNCQQATSTWASTPPEKSFSVVFDPAVAQWLSDYDKSHDRNLKALIAQLLCYDVRPAYKKTQKKDDKVYATTLYDVDIAWQMDDRTVTVISASVKRS